MKRTSRFLRGMLVSSSIILLIAIWLFLRTVIPKMNETFKWNVNTNVDFILGIAVFIFLITVTSWLVRNKAYFGMRFALSHYKLEKEIRKQLKIASVNIQDEYEQSIVHIPVIKIQFDDIKTRLSGKISIKNSIRFDNILEKLRLDSSLTTYITERQYLSTDRNWYVYEFVSTEMLNQEEFSRLDKYVDWFSETANDYQLRLDARTTVNFHHAGIAGQTGSGKTVFLETVCEQILNKNVAHELYIIDPKEADLFHLYNQADKNVKVADKDDAIPLIKEFHQIMREQQDEMQDFYSKNRNKTYVDAGLPAKILLIDEYGALRESWKLLPKAQRDEIDAILADIVFRGRQMGCFLWQVSQQLNASTSGNGTAVRDQLVLKIVLGNSDEQTYRTLFASSVDIPKINYKIGQGLIAYPNVANVDKPKLLFVPYCSFLDN